VLVLVQVTLQLAKLAGRGEVRGVGHQADVDAGGRDGEMGACVVSQGVLERIARGVVGLRRVADNAGDGREQDEEGRFGG